MKHKIRTAVKNLILAAINMFESPWGSAIASGIIYFLISSLSGSIFQQSLHPYYNYLADAFLHGQTWLRLTPPSIHDLSFLNGRYYLYWGLFPAILLMPFIAIFGVGLNDVFYTVIIAALNVGLVARLFRAANNDGFIMLTKPQRAILVTFFAFGTVHVTLAPFGKVWMTGQLIGFTCVLLSYLSSFNKNGGKAWFFTGLWLSGAFLTRTHMVFNGIFPIIYLFSKYKNWELRIVMRNLLLIFLPISLSITGFLLYNYIRFDNPTDTGYMYQNMAEIFLSNFETFGAFNIKYLPINFYYQYISYPFPVRPETYMGGSLFLLSPLFLSAIIGLWKSRLLTLKLALFGSIMMTNIPILLLIGTGWVQFGPRYSLDFTVPLLLLTAMGINYVKPLIILLFTVISVGHYIIGVKLLF